jgi:hypothetical protein
MGFYPVTPGSNDYIIGSPLFKKATINLENGKQFKIRAENISATHIYIKKVLLNNLELNRTYLKHDEIMAGGTLTFEMSSSPSKWGTIKEQEPITEIKEHLITPAPYINKGDIAFKNETMVSLANSISEAIIFYSLGSDNFKEYASPILISEAVDLRTYAVYNGIKSDTINTNFYKINPNRTIKLETEYANQYNAGGNNALIDGIRGSSDFKTGSWQGYQNTDLVATIDLGSAESIDTVEVNFLQDQRSWIFYPTEVECYVAVNDTFRKISPSYKIDSQQASSETKIKTVKFKIEDTTSRYIKIIAKNLGDLPAWHIGAPYQGKAWIFVDEIIVK